MRVLRLFLYHDVFQLDVEELVHALERAAYAYVVLELDCNLVVD
jgi:hypothetical protein